MLDLEDRLDELDQLGRHQCMRMVSGPQGPRVVLDGRPVSAQATSAGVRYLVEARPAPAGGFALVRTTETGPLGGGLVRRNLTVALLAGVAVAVVVGLVVGQLLARPLRRTAIAARLLRSGRRDVRVPVAGPAEVSDVAGAVNELADALARSEERQRRFLLSVSHELRTPLTAVRGFAESLADGVVTTEMAGGGYGRASEQVAAVTG